MSDTGRLTTLLEQYRDRLHTRGEEDHDEDIVYLLQVLESPLMKEYLTEASPEGGAALIQEMATVLQHHDNDINMSPQTRRRRKLARQASLRALKIALTPRDSPINSPRVTKTSENRFIPTDYPLIATSTGYGRVGGSHESTPSPRTIDNTGSYHQLKSPDDFQSNSEQIVPEITSSYNIDHIYISPYTGKHEYPVVEATSISPMNTDDEDEDSAHVLSNSTNTLIERTFDKKFSTGSKGYSDFIKKGLNSEDIRTPEMRDSQEEDYLLAGIGQTIIPTLTPPGMEPRPVLPSYTEALTRVKSFEDLHSTQRPNEHGTQRPNEHGTQRPNEHGTQRPNEHGTQRPNEHGTQQPNEPIHLTNPSPLATPTYMSTRGPPMSKIPPQNVPPISPPNAGQLVTFNLFKGNQGLGFSINKKKNTKKGELNIYIQDIQTGGIGEREGLCKGDYLISINKQNLTGIGLPTAVSLLQQTKGNVELVVYRKEGVAHVGSPSPTMLPWIPQSVAMTPINTNQPNSAKVKTIPPSLLDHRVTPSPPPYIPPPPQLIHQSTSSPPQSPLYSTPNVIPPPAYKATTNSATPTNISIATPTNLSKNPPPVYTTQPLSPISATPPNLSKNPPPVYKATPFNNSITLSSPISHSTPPPVYKTTPSSNTVPSIPDHLITSSSNIATHPSVTTPPNIPVTTPHNNSSQITELLSITLFNKGVGFGFSLVTAANNRTLVKSIVPNGIADKDGRLTSNDRIVYINGQSVESANHDAVTTLLKDINRSGHDLTMVIARRNNTSRDASNDNEEISSDTDSSSDYEDHEVELVKQVGLGLGIGINALVNDEKGVDRGIFIKSVNQNGPAGRNGNVSIKDRIIQVNEHCIKSLSNMEGAGYLRNSHQIVRLVLRRRRKSIKPLEVTVTKNVEEKSGALNGIEKKEIVTGTNDFKNGDDNGDNGDSIDNGDDNSDSIDNGDDAIIDSDELIIEKWRAIMDNDGIIKIAHINRIDCDISLGFTMESIFIQNDTSQRGRDDNIRHLIQSILPDGPVDQDNTLRIDDELLEINGTTLVGVAHDETIQLIQSAAKDVTIVVCRPATIEREDKTPPTDIDVSTDTKLVATSESEDDHHSNSSTMTSSSSPALHLIYLTSVIHDFSRRFERQSWRERHAELTSKLKERFEIRRGQYYRNLKERIDELEKVDNELEVSNQWTKDDEERDNDNNTDDGGDGKEITALQSDTFDYSSYPSPIGYYTSPPVNEMGVVEEPLPPNQRDSVASDDSSAGILSPVPGSGLWETDVIEVELERGDEGLGFSILDFADPVVLGDRVILVHSLVPDGTADIDGRLQKGDKLISVNGMSVVNHSLEFTVEQLKSTAQDGLVHICINRPIPDTPDINSSPSSFSPDNFTTQFFNENIKLDEEELERRGQDKERRGQESLEEGVMKQTSSFESSNHHDDEQSLDDDPLISDERHVTNNGGDDDPPPYTEVDPLERRKEDEGRDRRLSNSNSGRSLTPGTLSTSGIAPIPSHLHFNRTRSDEPARFGQINDSFGLRMMESTSEETLVASCSNQDLYIASQPSPKQHASPQMRGRSFVTNSNLTDYNQGMSQVATASPKSQEDSAQERASPDTSDTGDHSAETDAEPRFIEILKGANPLGMNLTEDKGLIFVKKIDSSSVLGRDGRIRVGDRIVSINGKTLEGLPISKVRSILKRASSNRSTKVKITYLPAPLPSSVSSGTVESSSYTTSVRDPSHYTQSHTMAHHYPMTQVMPHPMLHPHMAHNLPGMVPSQTASYQHWLPEQHMGYNHTVPIPTRPQVNIQGSYLEQPVPIKAPPPPYQLYQGPPISATQPYQTHWNVAGLEYQPPSAGPGGGWSVGLQNQLQYTPSDYSQYQGSLPPPGGMTATNTQQMSRHRLEQQQQQQQQQQLHYPQQQQQQQQPYRPNNNYHQYMQYKQHEDVGGASMRTGNGRYDMNQNRNVPEWHANEQSTDNYPVARKGNYLEPIGPHRIVEVKRDSNGSLGISLGLPDGGIEGVVIIDLSPACNAMNKGRLLLGDRILEVNGHNLRHATQSEAVSIIKHSSGPVKMLVQSYSGATPTNNNTTLTTTSNNNIRQRRFQNSPLHSNDGSWAIDEEEDEHLRQMFPNANGYLFEVTLNKGNGALGLSIWRTEQTQCIIVMQVQPGGLADQTARIRRGDEILQVNDCCVIGWRHEDVSRLLKQSPPRVNMILVRPLPVPLNSTQTHPTSSAGMQNLCQKLHVLQEQQQTEETGSHTMTTETANKMEEGGINKNNTNTMVDMSGLPLVKAITIERDDNIGLGFTVSEYETQGEPRVVVGAIVPNGPADKEGQLQLGDNIISIDGHKVIGTKYEKATHLLQQARSRGFVNLIVSSQTKLPSQLTDKIESMPQKRKNMSEKRKRVRSEGVTLRNKITKKPQIHSKRRPVSVDCEMKYDLSDITRINSQSSSKGEGSSSSSHSNRNSRTLSETEVKQGVDYHPPTLSVDQDVKPGKMSTVEIFRGNQSLGISIVGGVDSYQEGIIIHKVHPGTPAAVDGRLKSGDRIIKVGHCSVETATRDEVIKMIIESQSVVQLTVYRPMEDTPTVSGSGNIETVELIKPEQRGVGLMIIEDSRGVIVSDVVEGEAAAFTDRIQKGDKLLAINGEDISAAGRDHVISLLQNCRGKISISVQHLGIERSIDTTPPPSHHTGLPRKLPSYNSPSPPTNGVLQHQHSLKSKLRDSRGTTPIRDSRGTTPLRSDPSFGEEDTYPPLSHQYRSTVSSNGRYKDVVGQSIPDSAHIQLGHHDDGLSHVQHRNVRVVQLHRGQTGLGFSIVGGKGSPNGDLPICVRTVSRDSPAGKEGLLQAGDIIMAVNGISFDSCTHSTAVETLKHCRDEIMLTICSP